MSWVNSVPLQMINKFSINLALARIFWVSLRFTLFIAIWFHICYLCRFHLKHFPFYTSGLLGRGSTSCPSVCGSGCRQLACAHLIWGHELRIKLHATDHRRRAGEFGPFLAAYKCHATLLLQHWDYGLGGCRLSAINSECNLYLTRQRIMRLSFIYELGGGCGWWKRYTASSNILFHLQLQIMIIVILP